MIPKPISSKRLIILPTPRYLNTRNTTNIMVIINPLLELAKREENVKREAMNNNKKNKGITPGDVGLTK